ncbi:MAG TPA: adenylate/guanylate cyclase domain-containing protein [Gammaproteobacteria bacterium]
MGTIVEEVAILFADVSGSVRLFDALGDETAWRLIQKCLNGMIQEVKKHRGRVIKTIGDEIMCTFASADDAVRAAVSMQERIREDMEVGKDNEAVLSVRIGLHFGEVIPKDNDVFGDAVNLASRMASAARGGQIVTTEATAGLLKSPLNSMARLVDRLPVKGKRETINIFEIVWEEGATDIATGRVQAVDTTARLRLHYRGEETVVDYSSRGITLGRGHQANLKVNDANASRIHLRLEFSRGKFVITDVSVNGTHLLTPAGELILRRNESHVLSGTGMISLGREVAGNKEVVFYKCE